MGETESTLEVSVIITALDEEKNIFAAIDSSLRAFENFEISGEVIFVNDGSKDRTGDVVKENFGSDWRVRTIVHDSPRGVGGSFWEGVDIARGSVVIWLPGDNENDPREIFRYYKLLEHVDMVIPFVFTKDVRSVYRRALSYVYRFIVNTTFSTNFNYTNGTILYRKSILDDIPYKSSSFFFQTDILVRLTKKGYLFAEVPFRLKGRDSGSSKALTFPSFFNVVKGYLRLVRDYHSNQDRRSAVFSADSQTAKRQGDSKKR